MRARCPVCGCMARLTVRSTRLVEDGTAIRRRRACWDCGQRFTTIEVLRAVPDHAGRPPKRGPRDKERAADIVRRAKAGEPFAVIAEDYGVSPERVRQILKQTTGQSASDFAAARAEVRKTEAEARRVEVACETCRKPMRLWPFQAKVRRFCSPRCSAEADRIPNAELLKALRRLALRVGHTPGSLDIIAAEDMPAHTVYYKRFGSLAAAQERIGLIPNERGKPPKPLPAGWRNGAA